MGSVIHNKALKLRKQGWSYNIISARLGVNKSTLSGWLKDAPYEPNSTVLKRIKAGPRISGERRHAKSVAEIAVIRLLADRELGNISKRDLMMLGIGLYIGEGGKTHLQTRFVNADENVVRIAMQWFREICLVPNENFRLTLHIYPDISDLRAKEYWSSVTGIPSMQFGKSYVDTRTSKKINIGKLPFGTAHITVYACGQKRFGVDLHQKILGWIGAVYDRVNAGIV